MAENTETAPVGNVAEVTGGQIALSARNEGDGTWSVRLGPGGPILMDGLPREKALGIVGAPTAPYEPVNRQEAELADLREQCEQAASAYANAEAVKSDKEAGLTDERGRRRFDDEPEQVRIGPAAGARKGAARTEGGKAGNGGEAFDHDSDGKVGGSKAKA